MTDKVMELVLKISKQEEELYELDKTINALSEEIVNSRDKKTLLEEKNEDLKITHQLCNDDIINYEEQIKQLELNVKIDSDTISNLRKENSELKKSKGIKEESKEEDTLKKKRSENLSKILGMGIIKKNVPSLSKQMSKGIQKRNIPKDVLEKNLKKKKNMKHNLKK